MSLAIFHFLSFLLSTASAQQFQSRAYPYEILGLSESCFEAVNTTVSACAEILAGHVNFVSNVDLLGAEDLENLCTVTCRAALVDLKSVIESSCTAANDVMVKDEVAYPATYFIDRYIYAYDTSCRRDSTTNEFCDLVLAAAEASNNTDEYLCSDCLLGTWKSQLESPFGYEKSYEDDFASITSRCGANGYSFATPTVYALNATASTSAEPTCSNSVLVASGDSCASVARNNGVSTQGLRAQNGLSKDCTLPVIGTTLCLPETCDLYLLRRGDDCDAIATQHSTSVSRLVAWNPMLNIECTNLNEWEDDYICVSSPGGNGVVAKGDAVTTALPAPTNAQGESAAQCGGWYTVKEGDYCSLISLANGISIADFLFLNPQVDSNCTNLWLSYAYCVKAVGDITTYSGYLVTIPSTSFTHPVTTATSTATSVVLTVTQTPLASGTVEGCYSYGTGIVSGDNSVNDCDFVAMVNSVTVAEIIEWNPSLSESDCNLSSDYRYCVQKAPISKTSGARTWSYCASKVTLADIVPGTISTCSCFSWISGSSVDYITCEYFVEDFRIDTKELLAMNSWLGSEADCDAALISGLAADSKDRKYVCIAAAGTVTPT